MIWRESYLAGPTLTGIHGCEALYQDVTYRMELVANRSAEALNNYNNILINIFLSYLADQTRNIIKSSPAK